ncbi:phage tail fiber domain-containing protein [Roseibium alexandrii]|uniref:Phage T7 tail fiber protein n=1 Tax=Roseibium alexandrii (strain DSM 17067 / NCIMB 14079 / DFL-11) TaxID=244592 RepID=A0A5E8GTM1_ROSAD|nr:phage tail fiber protein [Roseibium alexandrii]EEE42866.1 Phage T7 tail fiber protein [Roseibium alexandrii DFL-11]
MANSFVEHLGDGSTTNFAVSFPYLKPEHVSVLVDGVDTSFTWTNDATVQISPAPAIDAVVRIQRSSSPDARLVDYQTPAILPEEVLNLDSKQAFYLAQEAVDKTTDIIGRSGLSWDALGYKLTNVGDPEAGTDVITYSFLYNVFRPELTATYDQVLALSSDIITVSDNISTISDAVSLLQGISAEDIGAVVAPSGVTVNHVPQWSTTEGQLKAGLPVGSGPEHLLQLDGDGKLPAISGENLTNVAGAGLSVGTSADNLVQLDQGGKLPAVDGSELLNLPAPGMSLLFETEVTTAVPFVAFTNLPTTYSHLLMVIEDASHDNAAANFTARIAVSNDNGVSYADNAINSSGANGSYGWTGGLIVPGYNQNSGTILGSGDFNLNPLAIGYSLNNAIQWRAVGGINAIRFKFQGGNVDAGRIRLYGY